MDSLKTKQNPTIFDSSFICDVIRLGFRTTIDKKNLIIHVICLRFDYVTFTINNTIVALRVVYYNDEKLC